VTAAISYGGGVQSTALIVLATRHEIPFDLALFANVGDDSERPETLDYVRRIVKPWAEGRPPGHRVTVRELSRSLRDGSKAPSLLTAAMTAATSTIIPVRMSTGAPGNRRCTFEYKIAVIRKELKRLGASKRTPATVALGISIDEYQRVRDSRREDVINVHPLIDLRLSRVDCQRIIEDAGLPPAPKSACWFCPFQKPAQWDQLRRTRPDLFAKAVELEDRLHAQQAKRGTVVWLTARNMPLAEAIRDTGQLRLMPDDDESCDVAGYCHI
jgi:hypothetical protein